MPSKFSTPVKALNSRAAGGARGINWAALAGDSDSDSDSSPAPAALAAPGAPRKAPPAAFLDPAPVSPPVSPPAPAPAPVAQMLTWESDPIMLALSRGDVLWGDLLCDEPAAVDGAPAAAAPYVPRETAEQAEQRRCKEWLAHCDDEEALLWRQPFVENLEMYCSDYYDTRTMSEEHYAAFMSWIYTRGWHLDCEPNRDGCKAVPDNEGQSRVWVPPSRFSAMAGHSHGSGCCSGHKARAPAPMAAPGTDVGRRKGAPVPRFCRAAGACEDEGCRYVHGDTIPRVNKPCGFGAACGASDPTGAKRSQCLFMHPGEEWAEGLTIQRIPAPAPTPTA